MNMRLILALCLGAASAIAAMPERVDTTRPDLPYNPGLYNGDGRYISPRVNEPAWTRAPFAADGGAFRVSKVAEGASKVETRERLLAIFEEVAKAYSYDVAANKAVPRDKKAEKAGTLRVLDQLAFTDALKGGQIFPVVLVEKRRCPACNGEKQLRPRVEKGENPDLPRKAWPKCPWSAGEADADFAVSYTVGW